MRHPVQARRSELRRLLAVLVQEQSALKSANIDRLRRLSPRKSALLERLEYSSGILSADKPLLVQIRSVAARNAALFDAVLAGIVDARRLLDGVRNPQRSQVYERDGQRLVMERPESKLEKRA